MQVSSNHTTHTFLSLFTSGPMQCMKETILYVQNQSNISLISRTFKVCSSKPVLGDLFAVMLM